MSKRTVTNTPTISNKNQVLTVQASMILAEKQSFRKASQIGVLKTSQGTLKTSGIKTYLRNKPSFIYSFYNQFRAAGFEQDVRALFNNSFIQQQDNSDMFETYIRPWILTSEIYNRNVVAADGIIAQAYAEGASMQVIQNRLVEAGITPVYIQYVNECLVKTTTKSSRKFDIDEVHNPFVELVQLAARLHVADKVSADLMNGINIRDLLNEQEVRKTSRASNTLLGRLISLAPDKIMDVSKIDQAGIGARSVARPRTQIKPSATKIYCEQFPSLQSKYAVTYQQAIYLLSQEANSLDDREELTIYGTTFNKSSLIQSLNYAYSVSQHLATMPAHVPNVVHAPPVGGAYQIPYSPLNIHMSPRNLTTQQASVPAASTTFPAGPTINSPQ